MEMGKYGEENGVSLRITSFVGTSLFMTMSQPDLNDVLLQLQQICLSHYVVTDPMS